MKKMLLILGMAVILFSCKKKSDPFEDPVQLQFSTKILDNYFVTSMAFDNSGNAWIGTFKQGLIKYKNGVSIVYNGDNSPFDSNTMIHDIKVDSKGNVWIGANGLIKFDGNSFTKYSSENSPIPEDYISSISIDSKDNVWFTSCRFKRGGLVKYDGKAFQVFTPANSQLPANFIQHITIDKNDDIWLAMSEIVGSGGLVKISGSQWTNYTGSEMGFTPYYLSKIAVNSKNQICGGINYMLSSSMVHDGPQVFIFNNKSSISTLNFDNKASVTSVMVDNKDNIWCTTSDGLAMYNGKKWTLDMQAFKDAGTFVISQAKDGKIWLGTGKGIFIK